VCVWSACSGTLKIHLNFKILKHRENTKNQFRPPAVLTSTLLGTSHWLLITDG
jgi:hypothetical protein